MNRVIVLISLLLLALFSFTTYWQYANCTTEFTEHGHPITICKPMEYRDR
jgi:hypothetical protein